MDHLTEVRYNVSTLSLQSRLFSPKTESPVRLDNSEPAVGCSLRVPFPLSPPYFKHLAEPQITTNHFHLRRSGNGQSHYYYYCFGVVDFHPAQEVLSAFAGQTIKRNDLVGQHLAPSRHRPPLHHQVVGVVLQPRRPTHALPS